MVSSLVRAGGQALVLTLKQLSKCLPRVSLPEDAAAKSQNPAEMKCAIVYCFHIKLWMYGHDLPHNVRQILR